MPGEQERLWCSLLNPRRCGQPPTPALIASKTPSYPNQGGRTWRRAEGSGVVRGGGCGGEIRWGGRGSGGGERPHQASSSTLASGPSHRFSLLAAASLHVATIRAARRRYAHTVQLKRHNPHQNRVHQKKIIRGLRAIINALYIFQNIYAKKVRKIVYLKINKEHKGFNITDSNQ